MLSQSESLFAKEEGMAGQGSIRLPEHASRGAPTPACSRAPLLSHARVPPLWAASDGPPRLCMCPYINGQHKQCQAASHNQEVFKLLKSTTTVAHSHLYTTGLTSS